MAEPSEEDLARYRAMSLDELTKEQIRTLRLMDICLCIPVTYKGNIELTDELRARYLKITCEYAQPLREMVADNIRLEDIASFYELPVENIERLVKRITKAGDETF